MRSRRWRSSAVRRRSRWTPAARRTPGRRASCRRSGRAAWAARRWSRPSLESLCETNGRRPPRIRWRGVLEPTSAQSSLTIRVRIDNRPGFLGRVTTAIGQAGGTIGSIDLISVDAAHTLRDLTVDTSGPAHGERILQAVAAVDGADVIDSTDRTFRLHLGGKIEMVNRVPVKSRDDLSMAYTPGVARVCLSIAEDRNKAFQYTI